MHRFWGRHKSKEITVSSKFSCSICNESIDVSFPVYTYRVDFTKCDSKDVTLHNFEYVIRCQNCGQTATIYYCADSHTLIAKCSVCGEETEIASAISSRTTNSERLYCGACTVMQP
jgi:transcription elongation factor Elf1